MNYAKINKISVADGIGVRVALYVSGCSLHCKGCHNPECWDSTFGNEFTENTMQEILLAMKEDYIQGITITGGHPLDNCNLEAVYKIVKRIKMVYPNKDIWLYTGYTWEEILELEQLYEDHEVNGISPFDIVKYCDVIVDGRYMEDLRDITLAFRGSSNQRIIDVKNTLKLADYKGFHKVILWNYGEDK